MQENPSNYPGDTFIQKPKRRTYWVKRNLRHQKPERGWPLLFSNFRIGNILKWLGRILLVFVILKLFWDVVPQLCDEKYYMDRFTVADNLSKQGITGESFTKQTLSNISNIDSSIRNAPYFKQFTVVSNQFEFEVHDLADVEYGGVSYRRLVNFLVNMISPRKIIKGNIISTEDGKIACQVYFPGKKFDFTVSITDSVFTYDKVFLLSLNTAYELIAKLDPVHFSIFKFVNEDFTSTIDFISKLNFKEFNKADQGLLYLLRANSLSNINLQAPIKDIFLSSAAADKENYLPYVQISHLHLLEPDYDSALVYMHLAEKALRNNNTPKATFFNQFGNYYLFQQRPDSALYYYGKGLEEAPDDYWCLLNRGNAYALKKEFDNASNFFDSFRLHCPSRPLNNTPFTGVFGYAATPTSYKEIMDLTVELWGNYKYGVFIKGKYFFDQRSMDSARHYFSRALALDGDFPEPLYFLGLINKLQGNYLDAAANFGRCLAKIGFNRDLVRSYAEVLVELGDIQGAIDILRKASMPHDYLIGSDLGYCEFRRNNIKRAEYFYLYSDKVNGGAIVNLLRYATLKQATGHYNDAIALNNRALNLDSNNHDALLQLANCYMQLGRYSEARQVSGKLDRLAGGY